MSVAPRSPKPPRRIERLLARRIPDGAAGRSSVLGDLHEEYGALHARRGRIAADLWYLAQALALALPWALAALGDSTRGRVSEAASGLLLDLRSTLRGLRRHPTLVVVGVGSLALGSGMVTGAATLLNGAWFAPLPWPEAERLIDLEDAHPTEVCRDCSPGTSHRAFAEWRTAFDGVFERIEASRRGTATLRLGSATSSVFASEITPGLGELLALRPQLGRLLAPDDAAPGAAPVAVLSHGLWQRAFGEDPGVIGRTLDLDGTPRTIVGVLDAQSRPLSRTDLLVPLPPLPAGARFGDRDLWVLGRLAEGVPIGAADEAVRAQATAMYAADADLEPGWSAQAVPLREVLARSGADPAASVAVVALCLIVLLVAALNLATLLLARVTQRAHELGVRAALGAGRLRVARAAVLDAVVLAGAGGLIGLGLTWIGRDLAMDTFAAEMPPWATMPIDLRVLAAAIGSVALAALVAGMLPLTRALATGAGPGAGPGASPGHSGSRVAHGPARDLLLGAQIVLGIVLVAGCGNALRTFRTVSDFDRLGYRWEGLQNVVIQPAAGGEAGAGEAVAPLVASLEAAVGGHPGVAGHALSRPLFLGSWGSEEAASPVQVSGEAEPMGNTRVPRHSQAVGAGFFEFSGIPILAGRGVGDSDVEGAPPVAVVSEDAARAMWPDRAPGGVVGESFTLTVGEARRTFEVVGVSAPVIGRAWSESGMTEPRIYTALAQTPEALFGGNPGGGLLLRVEPRGAAMSAEAWSDWLAAVAPEASVSSVQGVDALLRASIQGQRITGLVLTALAALVLGLFAIGIYGTVAYRVAAGRRELSIRIALGADGGQVVRSVGGRLARLVAMAVAVGAAAAWGADRVFAGGGVPLGDASPWMLAGVAALVAASAALACGPPLRAALRIDPAGALRGE